MVEITLPIVLQIIQTIGILVGIIYYITIMENSRRNQQLQLETRQAQLFAQIHSWWRSRDAVKAYGRMRFKYQWKDLQDYMEKYGPAADPEAYADGMTLGAFFEGLGVLVKKDLIDIELVEDLFSQRIIWFWEYVLQSSIQELRKNMNDPTQFVHIEYLYHEMKKRLQPPATIDR